MTIDPTPFMGIADPISATLHLGGAMVFAVLAFGLLVQAYGEPRRFAAVVIYVCGVLYVLTVSGLFHALARETAARHLLQVMDHAGIFFLIAASYTPIHAIQFRGFLRWGMLALVWMAAVVAIVLKSIWFDTIPSSLGLALYLGLGWAGLISAAALYRQFGLRPLIPLLLGALAYTVGAVLEFAGTPTFATGIVGPHEVFHVLVLVGIGMHWEYIRRVVVADRQPLGHSPAKTSLEFP